MCVLGAPKAHDAAEMLFGAPQAPVICSHFVKYAKQLSRSDCYTILLNMQRQSREATVMPRRRGEAASLNIFVKFLL